jgi:hypothetical protein
MQDRIDRLPSKQPGLQRLSRGKPATRREAPLTAVAAQAFGHSSDQCGPASSSDPTSGVPLRLKLAAMGATLWPPALRTTERPQGAPPHHPWGSAGRKTPGSPEWRQPRERPGGNAGPQRPPAINQRRKVACVPAGAKPNTSAQGTTGEDNAIVRHDRGSQAEAHGLQLHPPDIDPTCPLPVARMEPPGPAFGRPDDKLHVIWGRPIPDFAALHPGYKKGRVGQ